MLALVSIELANEEVVVDLIRLVLAVQVGPGVGRTQGWDWARGPSTKESAESQLLTNCFGAQDYCTLGWPFLHEDHKPWSYKGNH